MAKPGVKTRSVALLLAIILSGLMPVSFFSPITAYAAPGDIIYWDDNGNTESYTLGTKLLPSVTITIDDAYIVAHGAVIEVQDSATITAGAGNIIVSTTSPVTLVLNGAKRESDD